MNAYLLVLPFPPSLNSYYQNRRARVKGGPKAGKTYTARMISDEGKAYRQMVWAAARKGHVLPPKFTGRISVTVLARAPTHYVSSRSSTGEAALNNRWDLDNHWKCLLDAMTKAEVILDDALFDEVNMVRWNRIDKGSIWVAITAFNPDMAMHRALSAGVPELAFQDFGSLPF